MTFSVPPSDASPQPRNRLKPFLRLAGYLTLGVSALVFVRHVDGHALMAALGQAHPLLLAVAGLLALGQLACRASVFRTLILPVVEIPRLRVQRFMLATSAASALVPGRAGDFMRAFLLKRDNNVAVASTAAVTAVEKSIEILCLFLVLAPVPFVLPHLPAWVERAMLGAAGVAAGLLLMAILLATRARPPRWLASFSAGLQIVRRPALLAKALLVELGSWLLDFACVLAVMRSVGVSAPAASGLLVLLAVNLAMAIPVVPGNLGTFELGAVASLQPFGVPSELGLAVGLLYHMAQVLPVATLALLDSRFIVEK
ncbi:MAG TPA: lysylphosphatidylglycerol synthase transmembrane domain-containing protein [Polyangia bacterium]